MDGYAMQCSADSGLHCMHEGRSEQWTRRFFHKFEVVGVYGGAL